MVLVTRLVLKNICGWIDNWKKNFRLFYRYQPIIEPQMTFDSLLGSSKWHYKFWSFLNTRNLLLIDCMIVYGQQKQATGLIDEKQP